MSMIFYGALLFLFFMYSGGGSREGRIIPALTPNAQILVYRYMRSMGLIWCFLLFLLSNINIFSMYLNSIPIGEFDQHLNILRKHSGDGFTKEFQVIVSIILLKIV